MSSKNAYKFSFTDVFGKAIKRIKKKDKILHSRVVKQVDKIIDDPFLGKPLKNILKNQRRVHVGSFVLIYRIRENEIKFLEFDHHDKIYKKL